jgi:peptidoglycan hydrolase CwlO-like protein
MDKKLTDSEIVKALECCDGSFDRCGECPLDNVNQDKLRCWELEKSALDLIKHLNKYQDDVMYFEKQLDNLQAEKERLLQKLQQAQEENERYKGHLKQLKHRHNIAKSEIESEEAK